MAYRRTAAAAVLQTGDALTHALVGIGINLASKPTPGRNIEDTLLAASVEGVDHGDLRLLALLTTWLGVHVPWVNVDRLTRAVVAHESPRVRVYWSAVARWLHKDRRFARLARLYRGPRVDLLPVGTDFQVRRRGEDERFASTCLCVPAGVLRDRKHDVLTPAQLARRHHVYRQRVLMGPSYRADMWAALDAEPSLSAAELARRTYGSFATAWQVKNDYRLLADVEPGS
ncbi:MAG: hypothetical protein PHU25_06470 [Deltaproteobacteria bacterium]|nr:hypothetical protein [Deltaproteobacteria bacterium]